MSKSIAIVGAGVCGAVCARQLSGLGHAITIFDKGRGPGGRMSSRRTESGHRFDHGGCRIDVTQPAFHELLGEAAVAGVMHRDGDAYTSPKGANALCKWLLEKLPVRYASKIVRFNHDAAWTLVDEAGESHGPFDALVLAVPPVNAAEAVNDYDAELARTIASVRMLPRWVVMLAFAGKLPNVPDYSVIKGQIVRRSMSNTVGDAFVIEASQEWSIEHVEQDAAAVGQELLAFIHPALGSATPSSVVAHRWRYAFVDKPMGRPFLEGDNGLFICGDWCVGRSIESAWMSATAAVEALRGR